MDIPGPTTPTRSFHQIVRHVGGTAATIDRAEACRLITGICQDSREVQPGDIYAALPGGHRHGIEFAAEAASRGAVAMISDRASQILPTVVVADPRRVLGRLASWIYHDPSTALDLYGVTGTNGKTSTAYLLEAGLAATGLQTGIISGITVRGPNGSRTARRTTPEACELQQTLAAFTSARVDAVAMEVSSHGLAQHRIDGTYFQVAAFTNLGRDHLDFHPNMEDYFAAKARLFTPEHCAMAVIGIDDDYGRRLAASVSVPHLTFSAHSPAADVYADNVNADQWGTSFTVHLGDGPVPIRLRLLGIHQVDNALAAVAALWARGVDLQSAIPGLEGLNTVPGRLERIDAGQRFLAFVDYVHNTSGQRRLFPYLRSLSPEGKIIAVIGATGGRDPGKRAPLGYTAASFADLVIVTDESPFFDDPADLRNGVAAGARQAQHADVTVCPDRSTAISNAVSVACPGDIVLVAGRGHDPVLDYRGAKVTFDDRTALHEALLKHAADC